jgi:hypothetical protein
MKSKYTFNLSNEDTSLLHNALMDAIENREKGEQEFFHEIPKLEAILEQLDNQVI